jgi:hypothetical protein
VFLGWVDDSKIQLESEARDESDGGLVRVGMRAALQTTELFKMSTRLKKALLQLTLQ